MSETLISTAQQMQLRVDMPWFIILSDHKWFRKLAISRIMVETMKELILRIREPTVDIADILEKYHKALKEEKN